MGRILGEGSIYTISYYRDARGMDKLINRLNLRITMKKSSWNASWYACPIARIQDIYLVHMYLGLGSCKSYLRTRYLRRYLRRYIPSKVVYLRRYLWRKCILTFHHAPTAAQHSRNICCSDRYVRLRYPKRCTRCHVRCSGKDNAACCGARVQ